MKEFWRFTVLLFVCAGIGVGLMFAEARPDCTLEASEGTKEVQLANGVVAQMNWKTCDNIFTGIVFRPVSRRAMSSARGALLRAADLVSELQKKTGEKICPFNGDVASELRARTNSAAGYTFGEDIRVSNKDVAGWDGVSVAVLSEGGANGLAVRYWAKP